MVATVVVEYCYVAMTTILVLCCIFLFLVCTVIQGFGLSRPTYRRAELIPTERFLDAIFNEYNDAAIEKKHFQYKTVEPIKAIFLTEFIMLAEMPDGYPHCIAIYMPHTDNFIVITAVALPNNWNLLSG
uniref:hypothetical protein n=1 Tax=Methylomonas sp. PHL2-19 TaxID=3438878 RepID=UPI00402B840C